VRKKKEAREGDLLEMVGKELGLRRQTLPQSQGGKEEISHVGWAGGRIHARMEGGGGRGPSSMNVCKVSGRAVKKIRMCLYRQKGGDPA